MISFTCLQNVIEVIWKFESNHNSKVLKSFWKWCWKVSFSHSFDHNVFSTNSFWVRFISLKRRHLGLQLEHNIFLIWTYIGWVMTVWIRANPTVKIRVSEDACVCMKHACVCRPVSRSPELHFLWAPAPRPFETFKTL